MADSNYTVVKRQINKAENKIMQAIQKFQPDNLNNDLDYYQSKLKDIAMLQDKLEDLIYDVLNVPPEVLDEAETERLNNVQISLQVAVSNHEAAIEAKAAKLHNQELLDLEKTEIKLLRKLTRLG